QRASDVAGGGVDRRSRAGPDGGVGGAGGGGRGGGGATARVRGPARGADGRAGFVAGGGRGASGGAPGDVVGSVRGPGTGRDLPGRRRGGSGLMWVSVMLTIAGMSGAPAAPAGAAERPAAAAAESDRDAALRRVDAWIRATELRLAALHEGRNRIEAGEAPAAVLRELFERGAAEGSDDEGRPERGSYPDRRGDGRGRPLDPRGEERRGERRPELSEEELAEERAFVEERLPRLGERLREIEAKNPEAARRMLNRLSPRLREICSLTETDPDLAERRLEQMQSAMRLA